MIQKEPFGEYTLFTLSSGELTLSVSTLGATVQRLRYKGKRVGQRGHTKFFAGKPLGAL